MMHCTLVPHMQALIMTSHPDHDITPWSWSHTLIITSHPDHHITPWSWRHITDYQTQNGSTPGPGFVTFKCLFEQTRPNWHKPTEKWPWLILFFIPFFWQRSTTVRSNTTCYNIYIVQCKQVQTSASSLKKTNKQNSHWWFPLTHLFQEVNNLANSKLQFIIILWAVVKHNFTLLGFGYFCKQRTNTSVKFGFTNMQVMLFWKTHYTCVTTGSSTLKKLWIWLSHKITWNTKTI